MSHTIATALLWAKTFLSPRDFFSDAEILLAHTLRVTRSYLLAFSERALSADEFAEFQKLVERRVQGEPVAYLTGHKEFWSLDFCVTPDVLIPRPETELLVEQVLQKVQGEKKIIADLGTGTGAIALSLAHERPHWEIYATDASVAALAVAKLNAERLQCQQVQFRAGVWCSALPDLKFDAILSNPPYIAHDDPDIEDNTRRYEPSMALFANDEGLQAIEQIAKEARHYLLPNGYLMLEHGLHQALAVKNILEKFGYTQVDLHKDLAGLDRVTVGRWMATP